MKISSVIMLKAGAKEIEYELFSFNTGRRNIDVYTTDHSFRPNRVSEAFIKGLPQTLEGKVVYDIGSGGGIIALEEAFSGAQVVYAVEPADANYALLLKNIEYNEIKSPQITGKIKPYQGFYFNPLVNKEKADIITADVSGIPEKFGRALGWYPEGIDTGGNEGYEITCELLKRAKYYIKDNGILLFPTADDLLDAEKIISVAKDNFYYVKNALCSPEELEEWKEQAEKSNGKLWRSPEYVWFNLTDKNMESLYKSYNGVLPKTMNIQEIKGRKFWRGRIHVASGPKI